MNFNNLDIRILKEYKKNNRNYMRQQWERWVSGLNQWFAKPPKEAIPSEGSNPSLSAMEL